MKEAKVLDVHVKALAVSVSCLWAIVSFFFGSFPLTSICLPRLSELRMHVASFKGLFEKSFRVTAPASQDTEIS